MSSRTRARSLEAVSGRLAHAIREGQSLSQAGEWADQAKQRYTAENAPWMMHYAVNRPLGGLRGEGDLSPLLTWLRRYRT